jgi:hypothetical protein
MHVRLQIRQEVGIARVIPDATAAAPAVAEVLQATLWTGVERVVLDLREVPNVSAPLAVAVARAGRRIQRHGGRLVVVRQPTDLDRHDLLTLTEACQVVPDLPSSGWQERDPTGTETERRFQVPGTAPD